MPHKVRTHTAVPASSGRRLRRAMMEAGVVLSLTLAIMAVICLFGFQRASALELGALASTDAGGGLTIGALLLGGFVALCGLTTYMLRDTMRPARQRTRRGNRQG